MRSPWDADRYMAPDIEAAIRLLHENRIWDVVAPFIAAYEAKADQLERPTGPSGLLSDAGAAVAAVAPVNGQQQQQPAHQQQQTSLEGWRGAGA